MRKFWASGYTSLLDIRSEVLLEPGSGTRAEFEAALEAVKAGAGGKVPSLLVAEAGLRASTLVASKFDLRKRTDQVLRHRERHVSNVEAAFLALIEKQAGRAA